jgi:TIGR03009 family protein
VPIAILVDVPSRKIMRTNARQADGTRSVPATFLRLAVPLLFGFFFLTVSALAQTYPEQQPPPQGGAARPDQPVQPRIPMLVPRAAEPPVRQQPVPPQPPPPPFVLTPQQQAEVDDILVQWEKRNRKIETFDCPFKRWVYDAVFGPQDQPKFVELGVIRYAAPDRGLFQLTAMEKDGKEVPIENSRALHWVCDGKSIWEYDPQQKKVVEHKLPPELQGKAIAKSPLPFLFGAGAQNLKERYFIRIVTPRDKLGVQIWLEAYPRFQQDAGNFHHAIFIISTQGMSPFALRLVEPNAKDYTVYQFYNIVVNDKFKIFKGDPFRPFTPWGWKMIPDSSPPPWPPPVQARRTADDGRR